MGRTARGRRRERVRESRTDLDTAVRAAVVMPLPLQLQVPGLLDLLDGAEFDHPLEGSVPQTQVPRVGVDYEVVHGDTACSAFLLPA